MKKDDKIQIKEIQKKLEQLSTSKDSSATVLLVSLVQGPYPELQSVKDEIAHLKTREVEYLKIIQAAASIPPPVPEKNWSKSPFYSHTLKSWNFDYPGFLCDYFDWHWNCVKSSMEIVEY